MSAPMHARAGRWLDRHYSVLAGFLFLSMALGILADNSQEPWPTRTCAVMSVDTHSGHPTSEAVRVKEVHYVSRGEVGGAVLAALVQRRVGHATDFVDILDGTSPPLRSEVLRGALGESVSREARERVVSIAMQSSELAVSDWRVLAQLTCQEGFEGLAASVSQRLAEVGPDGEEIGADILSSLWLRFASGPDTRLDEALRTMVENWGNRDVHGVPSLRLALEGISTWINERHRHLETALALGPEAGAEAIATADRLRLESEMIAPMRVAIRPALILFDSPLGAETAVASLGLDSAADNAVRDAVWRVIRRKPDGVIGKACRERLKHDAFALPKDDVRQMFALSVIGEYGEEMRADLLSLLRSTDSDSVRLGCIGALGTVAGRCADPELLATVGDEVVGDGRSGGAPQDSVLRDLVRTAYSKGWSWPEKLVDRAEEIRPGLLRVALEEVPVMSWRRAASVLERIVMDPQGGTHSPTHAALQVRALIILLELDAIRDQALGVLARSSGEVLGDMADIAMIRRTLTRAGVNLAQVVEEQWRHVDDSSPVRREQGLRALRNAVAARALQEGGASALCCAPELPQAAKFAMLLGRSVPALKGDDLSAVTRWIGESARKGSWHDEIGGYILGLTLNENARHEEVAAIVDGVLTSGASLDWEVRECYHEIESIVCVSRGK